MCAGPGHVLCIDFVIVIRVERRGREGKRWGGGKRKRKGRGREREGGREMGERREREREKKGERTIETFERYLMFVLFQGQEI